MTSRWLLYRVIGFIFKSESSAWLSSKIQFQSGFNWTLYSASKVTRFNPARKRCAHPSTTCEEVLAMAQVTYVINFVQSSTSSWRCSLMPMSHAFSAPRCRLITTWGRSTSQGLGCSPIKAAPGFCLPVLAISIAGGYTYKGLIMSRC